MGLKIHNSGNLQSGGFWISRERLHSRNNLYQVLRDSENYFYKLALNMVAETGDAAYSIQQFGFPTALFLKAQKNRYRLRSNYGTTVGDVLRIMLAQHRVLYWETWPRRKRSARRVASLYDSCLVGGRQTHVRPARSIPPRGPARLGINYHIISYHRYFQHAHFIPLVGVGKRGVY